MRITFIHIPKTAGTSIHKVIEDNLGPIIWYPPRSTPELQESFLTSLDAFDKHLRHAPVAEQQELLRRLDAHPAIGGHTQYRVTERISRRFTFTSLRDPVDRFVSWYFHYVHPDSPHDRRPLREETRGMDIATFAEFPQMMHENDNIMVRFFADVPKNRPVEAGDLERAKQALSSLDVIIRSPTFALDMDAMMQRLGWGRYEPIRLKQGRSRARSNITDIAANVPESVVRFDRALWDYSAEMRAERTLIRA